jgi:hypothetical protein
MLAGWLASFFTYERIEQTSSSVNEWNTLHLHLWTNRTYFFISERMKHSSSSSSSSTNEWNVFLLLLLHLRMNGTSFFFIYERMERTFSSSLWTNGMHFFLIYEWMEHNSSSIWTNESQWLIDWYTLNECLLDGWMIPLKLHLLGLS